jgi:hypothetical protein
MEKKRLLHAKELRRKRETRLVLEVTQSVYFFSRDYNKRDKKLEMLHAMKYVLKVDLPLSTWGLQGMQKRENQMQDNKCWWFPKHILYMQGEQSSFFYRHSIPLSRLPNQVNRKTRVARRSFTEDEILTLECDVRCVLRFQWWGEDMMMILQERPVPMSWWSCSRCWENWRWGESTAILDSFFFPGKEKFSVQSSWWWHKKTPSQWHARQTLKESLTLSKMSSFVYDERFVVKIFVY